MPGKQTHEACMVEPAMQHFRLESTQKVNEVNHADRRRRSTFHSKRMHLNTGFFQLRGYRAALEQGDHDVAKSTFVGSQYELLQLALRPSALQPCDRVQNQHKGARRREVMFGTLDDNSGRSDKYAKRGHPSN